MMEHGPWEDYAGTNPDTDAMVKTVYGEARGEPAVGQQAVASVILNRARSGGGSPASIVSAPHQFEGYNDEARALDPPRLRIGPSWRISRPPSTAKTPRTARRISTRLPLKRLSGATARRGMTARVKRSASTFSSLLRRRATMALGMTMRARKAPPETTRLRLGPPDPPPRPSNPHPLPPLPQPIRACPPAPTGTVRTRCWCTAQTARFTGE